MGAGREGHDGRDPRHVGEPQFPLIPLRITQKQLADHLGCDVKVVNRIVNCRSAVSTEVAMKLGAAFRTTPDFWLNAQKAVDFWKATQRKVDLPPPLVQAS